jgi:hypothetical protein
MVEQASIVESTHKTAPYPERRWQYKGRYSAVMREEMPG